MRRLICLGILMVSLCFGYSSGANQFIIAPQMLREGVLETVVLNLHGVDGTVDVIASLNLEGIQEFAFNNQNARKPILMRIKYEKPNGARETNVRQYVQLIVTVKKGNTNVYTANLRMVLIENSGYLHVQTDRPIYRPEEVVKIRVVALTQQQAPESNREVELVIRIPLDHVGVEKKLLRMTDPRKFIETIFQLPKYPEYGVWSIQVRFTNQKVVKWSTINFEVRPYVLPTFNVRIKLDEPFIAVKEDMSKEYITGKLTARYSYGKTVSGSYHLVAKLKRPDFEKPFRFHQFPGKVEQRASILKGEAQIRIKTTEVRKAFPDVTFLEFEDEGASIIVEASVTGAADGVIESDISSPIPFVKSPYKIDPSRMSMYYTPGTAFEMKVDILNTVTEEPVKGVTVVLTGPISCGKLRCAAGQCCVHGKCKACEERISIFKKETDVNGQINVKLNMESNAIDREFLIQTGDFAVSDENEAQMAFTIHPYNSKSGSVLQLSATTKIARVGEDSFEIDVWYKEAPAELRYLIVARGSIFSVGIHVPQKGSTQTTMKISINGEMVPSFKIFVYYLTDVTKELVSNSLWIDVKDACKKEIEVDVADEVLPGQDVTVKYSGSPHALIGISAVDRAAYFLYGESRLSRKSAFAKLDQYDEGCVREGGKNAQHVFEEGGLQLVGGTYTAKSDFKKHCGDPIVKRKKRDAENNVDVEAKFEEEALLRRCGFDGMVGKLDNETCAERAERVKKEESYECAKMFNESCINSKLSGSLGARTAALNVAGFKALATTRSNFEESMLWRTEMLGPDGKLTIKERAEDSITTFEFDTISMHPTDGFCVAPTKNMRIFKNVFIQLQIPFSLKRREQTEIRATVFNYGHRSETIRVMVKMGKYICSHFPEEKFSEVMTLEVDPESAETTSFSILPLRIPPNEKVEIEVKALNEKNEILDHIRKWILVQPEGEIKDIKGTHTIDLKNKKDGYVQSFTVTFQFPEKYTVGTRQCFLYPFSNFMGPVIEFDPVTKQPKNDIKKLIRMPGGCGEQTMLSMGPNVYAHRYLVAVGKMLPGSQEEQGSIEKMKAGFTNELKYRCNCNPKVWSVFPRSAPSVWLNAYVNKVFAQAKQFYVAMDVTPICQSIGWLITMQNADGSIQSGDRVRHREMHGAVGSTLSLTAYVMISFVESESVCPQHTKGVETAIMKMTNYLKANDNKPQMEQPYALALVCYALSVSNPGDAFTVKMLARLRNKMQYSEDTRLAFWKGSPLQEVKGTGTHAYWYQRKPLAIDIEATGYALMAILHAESAKPEISQYILDTTRKIVLWLIEQRDENGGFTTTQDTVVGLQALSYYMIWSATAEPPTKEVSIDLTVSAPDLEKPIRIHLDKSYENFTMPILLPDNVISKGKITVAASGTGEGTLSHRCYYRTLVDEDSCHFDLAVTTLVHKEAINPRIAKERSLRLKISIQVSKPKGLRSGQSIVEVNLMSGYEFIEASLQQLSKELYVDGTIERYEVANQRVFLYLREITEAPTRLAFLVSRAVEVKDPEPATVTVYDYYEPSVRCSQFYGLPGDVAELRTTPCKNENVIGGEDMCKCAEGGCVKCRTRKEQLEKTSCLPGMGEDCQICQEQDKENCFNMTAVACKGTYAYKVQILDGVDDATGVFVEFGGIITEVFKRGPDVGAQQGAVRKFISRTDCYRGCADTGAIDTPDRDGNKQPYMMAKDMTVMIIGTLYEENSDKNGMPQRHYALSDAYMERVYPQSKCKKAAKDLKARSCTKDPKKRTKKQKAKCRKATSIKQSCTNFLLLRRMLIRGCDGV